MNMMELIGVSKNYGQKEVLTNIDLKIKKGVNLGLIGPTGCGKTTLLKIIDLIEPQTSGKIVFDGIDTNINKKERLSIRRRMGIVFQKPIVFKGTVFDNVAYGPDIRGTNIKTMKDEIQEILVSLGLEGYENQDASSLSGGETQRVALARALITQPELLLLDEPTANLDPLSTEKIESFILNLRKEKETTVILATHDLLQGQRLSDEIAILNQEIFQIGKPEEIFRKPKSRFVADFVGVKNVLKGTAYILEGLSKIYTGNTTIFSSTKIKGDVCLSIRPEDITLSLKSVKTSALNEFKGIITKIDENGSLVHVNVDVGDIFTIYMTRKSFLDLNISLGSEVWIQFKASAVHIFPWE